MAYVWHLKSRPVNRPITDNFELKEIALEQLREGEVRVRNLWLSVDPYMRQRMDNESRSYIPPFEVGAPLDGGSIGEVVASRASGFTPGDLVKHMKGWRDEAVLTATQMNLIQPIKDVRLCCTVQWRASVRPSRLIITVGRHTPGVRVRASGSVRLRQSRSRSLGDDRFGTVAWSATSARFRSARRWSEVAR